jgi:flagellar basal body-associated protein FliL
MAAKPPTQKVLLQILVKTQAQKTKPATKRPARKPAPAKAHAPAPVAVAPVTTPAPAAVIPAAAPFTAPATSSLVKTIIVVAVVFIVTLIIGIGILVYNLSSGGNNSNKDEQTLSAMQNQASALQQRLNELKGTKERTPQQPPVANAPAAKIDVNVNIRLLTPNGSTKISRPVVEIRDDIRSLQYKIADAQTDLSVAYENARADNSDPSRNIVRRANIVRMETKLEEMKSELNSLMAELRASQP